LDTRNKRRAAPGFLPRAFVPRVTLLAALLTVSLGLAACGSQSSEKTGEGSGVTNNTVSNTSGNSSSSGSSGQGSVEETGAAERTSGEDTGGTTSRAGRPAAGSKSVTLRIGGEPDLRFSGSCIVDGEERELRGRVPRTYTYEPRERLQCEVSNRDRGQLRVSFSSSDGASALQQVGPQPATLELTYAGNSLSTSTRSTSRNSSQSSQQSSSQSSSSSISSSQSSSQSSSSVTRSGEPGSGGSGGAGGSAGSG
jgi:hypothetical protein